MMIIIYYYIFICLIMGIQGSLDKKKQRNCFSFPSDKKDKKWKWYVYIYIYIYIYTLSYCTQQ